MGCVPYTSSRRAAYFSFKAGVAMTLQDVLHGIVPVDETAKAAAQEKWNGVGKPLGSLGELENMVVRMAGVFGSKDFDISSKAVVIMCADNGVVEEGVTQTGQEVTAVVAGNMARRQSSVCKMARVAGARIYPVDVGMAFAVEHPGIAQRCISRLESRAGFLASTRDENIQLSEIYPYFFRDLAQKVGDFKFQDYDFLKSLDFQFENKKVLLGKPYLNNEFDFLLAFTVDNIALVAGGNLINFFNDSESLSDEDIKKASNNWMVYYLKYWLNKGTPNEYKKDFLCEENPLK